MQGSGTHTHKIHGFFHYLPASSQHLLRRTCENPGKQLDSSGGTAGDLDEKDGLQGDLLNPVFTMPCCVKIAHSSQMVKLNM